MANYARMQVNSIYTYRLPKPWSLWDGRAIISTEPGKTLSLGLCGSPRLQVQRNFHSIMQGFGVDPVTI